MKNKKQKTTPPINAINLSDKIKWWKQDGNFNGKLYLKICELKNRIPN